MTYVREYGRPDLFITMTCNPNWEMIKALLLPGQQSSDRQDVVARVFQQNVDGLWTMLDDGRIFGTIVAMMYTIEWQKRGEPFINELFIIIASQEPSLNNFITWFYISHFQASLTVTFYFGWRIKYMLLTLIISYQQSCRTPMWTQETNLIKILRSVFNTVFNIVLR